MTTPATLTRDREPARIAVWAIGVLCTLWQMARFPQLAVLRLFDPMIRVTLSALALLSLLTALLFAMASRLPTRSLIVLMAFGVACSVARILYEKFLNLLSR